MPNDSFTNVCGSFSDYALKYYQARLGCEQNDKTKAVCHVVVP